MPSISLNYVPCSRRTPIYLLRTLRPTVLTLTGTHWAQTMLSESSSGSRKPHSRSYSLPFSDQLLSTMILRNKISCKNSEMHSQQHQVHLHKRRWPWKQSFRGIFSSLFFQSTMYERPEGLCEASGVIAEDRLCRGDLRYVRHAASITSTARESLHRLRLITHATQVYTSVSRST